MSNFDTNTNLFYFTALSSQDLGYITARAISGSTTVNPQLAGQYFMGFSCSVDYQNYGDILSDLGSAFNSAMPGTTTTFRYDLESQRVIMSSSLNTTWFFQTSSMKILGFNQQYNSQNVITGNIAPAYIWVSTYDQRADDTGVFEDQPIYTERIADSGRSYAIGQIETINMRFWGHNTEPKENVFAAQKVDQFTWEEWIRENRKGPYPFVVFNSADTTTLNYQLRDGTYLLFADSMKFDPKQIVPGFYDFWNIENIKTRVLSEPNNEDNFDELPLNTGSFFAQQGNLNYHFDASAGSQIRVSGNDLYSTQYYDTSIYLNSSSLTTGSNMGYNPGSSLYMNGKPHFSFTSSLVDEVPLTINATASIANGGHTLIATIQLPLNTSSIPFGSQSFYSFAIQDAVTLSDTWLFKIDSTTKQITFTQFNGPDVLSFTSSLYSITESQKLILISTSDYNTNETQFYINGITQSISVDTQPTVPSFQNPEFSFVPGNSNSSLKFDDYRIADFMYYGNKLSASQLNNLQTYFGNRYGISFTPIT